MNQQLVSHVTTIGDATRSLSMATAQQAPEYSVEAVTELTADQRIILEDCIRARPFGAVAIPWCEMLRSTNLPGVDLYYLIISSDGSPKALAIFYVLKRLNVAKYISCSFSKWLDWLARWGIRPLSFNIGFLDIPFTNMVGVLTAPEVGEQERNRMTVSAVDYLQKKTDIHVLVTTTEPTPELRVSLDKQGFIQISAPPNTMLATPFKTFNEYLASLSKKVRWDVKDKIRRFEEAGGRIEQRIHLDEDATAVYELFQRTCQAHEGQEIAWPVQANFAIFERVETLGDSHRMLLAYIGDRLIGFLMLVESGDTLFFKFCGLDYELSRDSMAYFNLFYEGIRYGIERGCRQVSLGPTSYFNKQRLGAELRPLDVQLLIVRGSLRVLRRAMRLADFGRKSE
jgi:hypothetical protein